MNTGKYNSKMNVSIVQYACEEENEKTVVDTGKRLGGFFRFEVPFVFTKENMFQTEDICGHIHVFNKETVVEIMVCESSGRKICSWFSRIPKNIGSVILAKGTAIPLSKILIAEGGGMI